MAEEVVPLIVRKRTLFIAYVVLFCGVVWGAQQTAPRQATPAQPAATTAQPARAKVTGTVNSAAGQPVRKASVTLMPANQGNRGQNGFAGPGQGGESAPVGTVYVALADLNGCRVSHRQFLGDRTRIRQFTTQMALDLLRRRILGL